MDVKLKVQLQLIPRGAVPAAQQVFRSFSTSPGSAEPTFNGFNESSPVYLRISLRSTGQLHPETVPIDNSETKDLRENVKLLGNLAKGISSGV